MPKLTSLFAATTVIAGIVAVYLWQQLYTERRVSAELRERVARVDPAALPADSPQTGRRQLPVVGEPAADARASELAGQGPAARSKATTPSMAIDIQAVMADPEFRKAQLAQMRLQVRQVYPDLGKALGLTSTELAALLDLLARHMEVQMTRSFDPASGSEARQDEQRTLVAQQQANQAEIEQLLGPARNEQWKDYQSTLAGRQRVVQLRTMLANTEHPLAAQQEASLLETALAENARRRQQAASVSVPADLQSQLDYQERILKDTAESNDRVADAARAYLSAPQLEVIRGTLDQQLAIQRAMLRARRAQLETQGESATQAASGSWVMGTTEGAGPAVVIAQ
jgi:hypothetical protein